MFTLRKQILIIIKLSLFCKHLFRKTTKTTRLHFKHCLTFKMHHQMYGTSTDQRLYIKLKKLNYYRCLNRTSAKLLSCQFSKSLHLFTKCLFGKQPRKFRSCLFKNLSQSLLDSLVIWVRIKNRSS